MDFDGLSQHKRLARLEAPAVSGTSMLPVLLLSRRNQPSQVESHDYHIAAQGLL